MKKTSVELYKTDNFYLTGYLITQGFELNGIEPDPSNSNKYIFCFLNDKDLREEISNFFSYRAVVKPQDYNSALNNLRSLIHSKR